MEAFLDAVAYLGTLPYWEVLVAGTLLAIVHGLLPGIGSLTVMAILLPFIIFHIHDPAVALVLLAAITGTGNTLDSLPAVVIGLPGSSTQVTFLEGHQLARRGEAAYALGAVYAVSGMGGLVGAAALAMIIPVIKPFILMIDRSEIAVIAMFGIAMVAVLSRGAMIKGITAGLLGVLVATVGVDPFTGARRFTFGQIELWEGLPLVAVVTGIFAIPEMIDLTITRSPVAPAGTRLSQSQMFQGGLYGLKKWKETIRQSLFGVFLGAIPGVGSAVIDWLAYAFGILWRKDRHEFGRGSLDGLLFAESAQNSKEGGQALPTLVLGIPGGTGWLMILAAMLMYGISPGPPMVGQYAHITMLIVFTIAFGNLLATVIAFFASAPLIRLTTIPYPAISAVIIPLVVLAAFMDMRSWLAIPILGVFSVIGLLMKRFGWPRPPLNLGFILGPIIDVNIQTAFSLYGPVGVLTRPLTIILLVLLLLTAFVFTRFMARAEKPTQLQDALSSNDPPKAESVKKQFSMSAGFAKAWSPLLVMAGAALALQTSLDYPPRARMLPLGLSVGIIALSAMEIFKQMFRTETGPQQIMDLGMRSSGMEGATQAGWLLAGVFAIFVLLTMTIRLDNAAIAFAVLLPLLFLSGWQRWFTAVVTGGIIAAWTYGFMTWFMAVIWPETVLAGWVLELFGLRL
ncbi:MAG: tripartite tricarboxylate transporter permease [Deltaproteobacteria bacterium]|nr:tripartite tricarboxylate transporter permease [Deltaproteobacteria bacterium]